MPPFWKLGHVADSGADLDIPGVSSISRRILELSAQEPSLGFHREICATTHRFSSFLYR
jgi:hypothetical protein